VVRSTGHRQLRRRPFDPLKALAAYLIVRATR
jgi:hypothetical protein